MRKARFFGALPLAAVLLAGPALAVDVDVHVQLPGVRVHIGDRDGDGLYWDGGHWREQGWWHENCPRFRNHKDFRGNCDAPPNGPKHCPPGQAKKGNC